MINDNTIIGLYMGHDECRVINEQIEGVLFRYVY